MILLIKILKTVANAIASATVFIVSGIAFVVGFSVL